MTVKRFDRGEVGRPVKTPEGWLLVHAKLSRTGVFVYRDGDGKERRELRLPEEVFNPEHLDSIALRPVTDEHPEEWVNAENVHRYAVGTIGENVRRDGEFIAARLMITDASAVAHLENRTKVELSLGYVCELEEKPGVWKGERYDAIQRRPRVNHCALVEQGRAGPEARVRMDKADAVQVPGGAPAPRAEREEKTMAQTVRIDGVDYEGSAQLQQVLSKRDAQQAEQLSAARADADKAKKDAETAATQVKELKEKLDAAEKALKEATDPKKLDAAVKARASLLEQARRHLPKKQAEKLDGMTDAEIQTALIGVAFPKKKMDGKDAAYIAAAFELAQEALEARAAKKADAEDEEPEEREDEADEADEAEEEHEDEADEEDEEDEEPAVGLAAARAAGTKTDRKDTRSGKRLDEDSARRRMVKDNAQAWQKPLAASKDSRAE